MILHLETATKICSVALSDKGKLIAFKEENSESYTHSENLTVFVMDVLKKVGKTLKDLDAISVTSGPGSYTGLRIGVSTAKGFCYALNIPLISVDSLISIATQLKNKDSKQLFCPMIDARRMEVFSAIYNSELKIVKPISADVISTNTYAEFGDMIACGDGAEKLKSIWKSRSNVTFKTNVLSSAKGQVAIAWQKYKNQHFENVAYFEPFYLKDFK